MKFSRIAEAQEYLFSYRKTQKEQAMENFKFARVSELATRMGNPQNQIHVIHVAGTSGKGSTSFVISKLLTALGKKTGLSISPHVYDIRERTQINNDILSERVFLDYVEEIVEVVESMRDTEYGLPSFFEVMIVLAYYVFYKEGVDYAVMETGLGGRLDASNVATSQDKIAVLTRIGLDHTDVLGKTLSAIASQKADIIHEGNIVVSIKQRPEAMPVVEARARHSKTRVNVVTPGKTFHICKDNPGVSMFDFDYKDVSMKKIELSLSGEFQVENTSVALSTVYEAALRDGFDFNEEIVRNTLRLLVNPGRFDEMEIDGKKVIIDGAHNPQKMSAFIKSLKKKYPEEQFDFLIAFKHGKDFSGMLKYIVPHASRIYATEFVLSEQVEVMKADTTEDIERVLKNKFHFTDIRSEKKASQAFKIACKDTSTTLVVTGSLYLVSELYRELRNRS